MIGYGYLTLACDFPGGGGSVDGERSPKQDGDGDQHVPLPTSYVTDDGVASFGEPEVLNIHLKPFMLQTRRRKNGSLYPLGSIIASLLCAIG